MLDPEAIDADPPQAARGADPVPRDARAALPAMARARDPLSRGHLRRRESASLRPPTHREFFMPAPPSSKRCGTDGPVRIRTRL